MRIPYVAIGGFYCCQGGTESRSKELLRKGLEEYDNAASFGRGNKTHRVCQALFAPATIVRVAMEQYIANAQPMWKYPALFRILLTYALMPFAERRIEEIHSRIRRVGLKAFGCGLPYVCAAVRVQQHIEELKKYSNFWEFAVKHWRQRSILDKLFQLRVSDNLKEFTTAKKSNLYISAALKRSFVIIKKPSRPWRYGTSPHQTIGRRHT